jgi:hypothetical protein
LYRCGVSIVDTGLTVPVVTLLAAGTCLGDAGAYARIPYVTGDAGGSGRDRITRNTSDSIPEVAGSTVLYIRHISTSTDGRIPSVTAGALRGYTGYNAGKTYEDVSTRTCSTSVAGLNTTTDGGVPVVARRAGLHQRTTRTDTVLSVPDVTG